LNQYNWTISDAALENVTLATKWSDLEKILMKSTTPKLTPNNFVLNSQPRHWDDLSKFEKGEKLVFFTVLSADSQIVSFKSTCNNKTL
jgi:hypothetical protein